MNESEFENSTKLQFLTPSMTSKSLNKFLQPYYDCYDSIIFNFIEKCGKYACNINQDGKTVWCVACVK